jgi:hypothetical protein
MLQVIKAGASDPKPREKDKTCPFCGEYPPLASRIAGRFIVACENDDCHAYAQASGDTPEEAWANWNKRA